MQKDADVCFHVPPKARHTQSAKPTLQHFSKLEVRALYKILRTVQHQRIGNTVFLGVLHHITLEKAQIDHVAFRIVLHRKLGKGVAVPQKHPERLPEIHKMP